MRAEELGDRQLVAQALAGEEEAYRQLILRYQRPVLSLLMRMVRDAALAEDLAQEAFVKACRALASYDPQRRFSSWLFKIAHNTAIDHLRRSALPTVPFEGQATEGAELVDVLPDRRTPGVEVTAEKRQLVRHLEAALGELEASYREAMLLRFREGLSYQEIAEITRVPIGTVKTRLHRARKQLVGALERRGWTALTG